MRCQLAVLSVTVCLVLMIWAAVPARAQGAEAPVWTEGDFWKYEGTVQAEGTTVDLTIKLEVSGTEQVSVRGTIYECYHLDGTVRMKIGGISMSLQMDTWVRISDIASVRLRVIALGEMTTISYDPPVSYAWPLEVGKEWNGTATMIMQSSTLGTSEETFNYTAKVERLTTTTVPAGTFETYETRITMQGQDSLNYYAPEVGYDIRMRSSEFLGSDDPIDLVDFKFGSRTPSGSSALDFIWYILILIVIVVVVAVAILAWRKRRKAAARPPEMPQQPPQEPPPPPEW